MLLEKQNLSFDEQLSDIPNLNWLPWVGQNFSKTGLLLLGDSYYDDKDESEWLLDKLASRHLVNNQGLQSHLSQFSSAKFFRKIEQTVLSQDTTTYEERDTFWTSVSYFNLVQRLLSSRDNEHRPSDSDFDLGWHVALEVAKIIKPQVILKLGIAGIGRLGNYLNNNDTGWERNSKEFYKRPFIINLRRPEQELKIVVINHPTGSRGFDYVKWAKVLSESEPKLRESLIGQK